MKAILLTTLTVRQLARFKAFLPREKKSQLHTAQMLISASIGQLLI